MTTYTWMARDVKTGEAVMLFKTKYDAFNFCGNLVDDDSMLCRVVKLDQPVSKLS